VERAEQSGLKYRVVISQGRSGNRRGNVKSGCNAEDKKGYVEAMSSVSGRDVGSEREGGPV
jgi:hypothetical protein